MRKDRFPTGFLNEDPSEKGRNRCFGAKIPKPAPAAMDIKYYPAGFLPQKVYLTNVADRIHSNLIFVTCSALPY